MAPHRSITIFIEIWLVSIQRWGRKDDRILWPSLPEADLGWALEYQELESLFRQMANRLDGDLYWVEYGDPKEMKEMKDPEFLHEALQRIIFSFLVEHRTKPFMGLDKHSLRREIEPQHRLHAEGQFSTGKRTHSTVAGESEFEVSRASKHPRGVSSTRRSIEESGAR